MGSPLARLFLSQALLSLSGRGHCKNVEAVVEVTLSRMCAAVDARCSEDEEDIPSPPPSPPSDVRDLVWAEDPFLLE